MLQYDLLGKNIDVMSKSSSMTQEQNADFHWKCPEATSLKEI
jgi:hypothetical protein